MMLRRMFKSCSQIRGNTVLQMKIFKGKSRALHIPVKINANSTGPITEERITGKNVSQNITRQLNLSQVFFVLLFVFITDYA